MKKLVILFSLIFSPLSFSRQYIQCSSPDTYSSEVIVVNLINEKEGTLFYASGMENPEDERLLFDIKFDSTALNWNQYLFANNNLSGMVRVPTAIINKVSDNLTVELQINGANLEFNCFSRIYPGK
jgi:hypothetical protein